MNRVGMRRGLLSALVLVTATVGLVAVGFVGQASAVSGVVPIASGSQSVNPNKSITANVTTAVPVGDTVVVSVATGTFTTTAPGCSDSTLANTYTVVADKNTGSGRLFVCTSTLTTPLTTSDTITATYPAFSGLSVITAIAVCGPFAACFTGGYTGPVSTNAGSNPAVSSGSVTVGDTFLVGVVAHSNVSTFAADPGWNVVGEHSGGSGAAKRTVTPMWMDVTGGTFNATGTLSGSGFWQAVIITFST